VALSGKKIIMTKEKIKLIIFAWRMILIISILVFLFWLCWQNSISGGHLKVANNFCSSERSSVILSPQQKFISNFYPIDRVGDIEIDDLGRCFQRIISDPAYFKIILSRSFSEVKLKIYYQSERQDLLQIGLMKNSQGPLDWAFQLQTIENKIIKPKVIPQLSDDFKVGQVDFSVTSDFDAGRQLEFILSAPTLSKNQGQIKVYKIEADLIRQPLTMHNFIITCSQFWQKLLNKFK
jgi:hypothetical protein